MLRATGELTPKLTKTINTLEKAVSEFSYVTQNAKSSIEMVSDVETRNHQRLKLPLIGL